MKYIFSILIFILINCKGQNTETLEEIKSINPTNVEILAKKVKTDSVGVNIYVQKKYLLKTKEKSKLIFIDYNKSLTNNNSEGVTILREDFINLGDTINIDIKYFKLIHINELKNLTRKVHFERKTLYNVLDTHRLNKLLKEYRNDELRFVYSHEKDRKKYISKSIPVNLKF